MKKAKAVTRREKPVPEPVLAKVSPADAMAHFKTATAQWQGSSLLLVVSGAICLIAGLYSQDKVDYETTILKMKAEVALRGIKEAQSYKYIGLARYLVQHLNQKFPVGGPILDVTRAEDWESAAGAIQRYLEKAKVKTLDDLGVLLGRYQRTPTKPRGEVESPSLVPSQAPGGNVVALPTRAQVSAIQARIKAQPDILTGMKPIDFAHTCVKSGRDPAEMIEAFIPYLTSTRQIAKIITRLEKKAEAIKSGQVSDLSRLTG